MSRAPGRHSSTRSRSHPRSRSRRPAFLDAYSVAPSKPADTQKLLNWFAELLWLSENHGAATPALWHERMRSSEGHGENGGAGAGAGSGSGLSRASSNRHFARLKNLLEAHGVPHERVKVEAHAGDGDERGESMVGIRIGRREGRRLERIDIEKYYLPLKRCMRKACVSGAHEKPVPARPPHFYRNAATLDGLSAICASCERAKKARDRAAGKKQARTKSLAASHRAYNSSEAGKARTRKHRARRRGHDIASNEFHASTKEVYSKAVSEFATLLGACVNGHPGDLMLSQPHQHSEETNSMPLVPVSSAPALVKPTGELLRCLNALAVLGPGVRVTERKLNWLLAAAPSLEPPRVNGHRMFGPVHEAAIRAAFEAKRKADEQRKAAKAVRTATRSDGAPAA